MQNILPKNSQKRKNTDNIIFCGVLGAMLLITALRILLNIDIPVLLLLALSIIPIVFLGDSDALSMMVCLVPLFSAFQFKYAIFAYIIIAFIKNRYKIKYNNVALTVLLMMLWELLHFIINPFSFFEFLRCFAELILLVLVVDKSNNKKLDYEFIVHTLATCTVIVSLIMLLAELSSHGYSFNDYFAAINDSYRFGANSSDLENFNLNFNPNTFGFICNLSLSGYLILAAKRKLKIYEIAEFVLLFIFGLLTLSRTFLFSFIIILAIYLAVGKGTSYQKVKRVLIMLFSVTLLFIFISVVFPLVYEAFKARFTYGDLSNGRFDLFNIYLNHIFSGPTYFLFGLGMQNYTEKLKAIYGVSFGACHNGFQQIIVVWGIVGLALFIAFVIFLVHTAKKNNRNIRKIQYLPLMLILFHSFAGQLITNSVLLLALSFAYISMSQDIFSEGDRFKLYNMSADISV